MSSSAYGMQTYLVILITVIVSVIAWNVSSWMQRLIFWVEAIQQKKQYDRFITYGFVHHNAPHLIFNMLTLYFFGPFMESFYRSYAKGMGYILFYLGALICSTIPSYIKNKDNPNYMALGASGAVTAVVFAFILFKPWAIIWVFFIPMPAIVFAVVYLIYCVWAEKHKNDNIGHNAHFWGAIYGIVVTLIVDPDVGTQFINQLSHIPYFNSGSGSSSGSSS